VPEGRSARVAALRRGLPPIRHLLHLAALWSLAVAQPLFDLLGRNAEFFAIRRSAPEDIVIFAVGLVLLPPLVLAGVEALLGLVDERVREAGHLVLVGVLVGLLALTVLKRSGGSSAVLVPLAGVIGAAAMALYARAESARSFLTVLAPAPAVVVALFLFGTPVHRLLSTDEASAGLASDGGLAPVVIVLFDELPITSLLGSDGRIDRRRYPNFAALVRDSLWFRNTASVDAATEVAVPAIFTGRRPGPDTLPTADDQPRNVFTLLGRGRRMHVYESVSDLCPDSLCPEDTPGFGARMRSLVSDLGVVSLHVMLPDDLRRRLPSIDQRWQGFTGTTDADDEPTARRRAGSGFAGIIERKRSSDDRAGLFERFTAGIPRTRRGSPGPLNVLHTLLPHVPWEYLPDGQRYLAGQEIPGLDFEQWSDDRGAAEAGLQRHLLQLGYVDRLLGRLLRRLRADGSYDETLLVVTADHGVALRAGESRREVNAATAADILPVPLFMKAPRQRRGRVVDTHLQTVDVLPTIAALLKIRVPWRIDGVSAFAPNADRRSVRATNAGANPFEINSRRLDALRAAALRRQVALVGEGGFPRLRGGRARVLLGRRVAQPRRAPAGTFATVDDPAAFGAVDLAAPTIPLHVSGELHGGRPDEVAIAVNGRIGAVVSVFRDKDRLAFSALLPRSLLREGANRVDVLGVTGRGRATRLVALGRAGGRQSAYAIAGGRIRAPGGRQYRIVDGRVLGGVDRSVRDAGVVHFSGWAAQAGSFGPVEEVVGFRGGRLIFSGAPGGARPDIGRMHRVPPDDLAFRFDVAETSVAERPRVFALSRKIASPLRWFCGGELRQDVGC
jgi:hypothetical protein